MGLELMKLVFCCNLRLFARNRKLLFSTAGEGARQGG